MIKDYSLFLENLNLQIISESIIYYSPRLRFALEKIYSEFNDAIAQALLNIESEDLDIKPDMTFIDLGQVGYLSFVIQREVDKLLKNYPYAFNDIFRYPNKNYADQIFDRDSENSDDDNNKVTKKSRQEVRIGKIVRKLLPSGFTDRQIELFVNQLKSTIENSNERFVLVKGSEIKYWYDDENYFSQKGTLGRSCMKGEDYFSMYTHNEEKCSMLCLIEMGKLKGRAIVWEIDNNNLPFKTFMDRVYTNLDSDVNKFHQYALSQGWGYRLSNSMSNFKKAIYKSDDETIEIYADMKVSLKPWSETRRYKYPNYPYMDTFKGYDVHTGILYNVDDDESIYLLEDTDGSFIDPDSKWSDYYDRRIPQSQAVWSEPLDTWIISSESVQVEIGNLRYRGYYPEDHSSLVYDNINDRYMHKYDSVKSNFLDTYLLEDDSTKIIIKLDEDLIPSKDWVDYDYNYIDIDEQDSEWINVLRQQTDNSYIDEKILTRNYKNSWIPKIISLDVVEYKDIFLTEFDANLLGIELDFTKTKVIDVVEYNVVMTKDSEVFSKIKALLLESPVSPEAIKRNKQFALI